MRQLLFLLIILLVSCQKDQLGCADVNCTEEYRVITVTLVQPDGSPVRLDSMAVVERGSGANLLPNLSAWEEIRAQGTYPIFEDSFVQEYRNREVELEFRGYLAGQEVVSAVYVVGADCCHVRLVRGDSRIEVEVPEVP
ncbi:hypothetical protein GCM10027275_44240 [Rhabdobacter roseus]|uniref:Lipoprotein n=1 Tax=Rhabdobacter roseus TaxID=1655419 RepID=A0A840U3V0_9BACT|nr:hypothetical protein [Rhabdobacter roseus]MBB5286519.1 hypothetical protein [Rhabdobacter roseus]